MNKPPFLSPLLAFLLCSAILAALLAAGCTPAAPEPLDPFVYEILPPDGDDAPPTAALRDRAIAALEHRRDAFGWDKITFTPEGDTRIVFGIPKMPEREQNFVWACLAMPGHFAIRAVAPENDAWLATLAAENLAPGDYESVSTPDGTFWRETDPAPEDPHWVIPDFAVRPGFEIRLNPFENFEQRDLLRPWYVSTDDILLDPGIQTVTRRETTNDIYRISAILAPADRAAYAAIATDPATGAPRRIAFTFDRAVWYVATPTPADLRNGVIRLEGLPAQFGISAEAFLRSAPIPCKFNPVESPPPPATP